MVSGIGVAAVVRVGLEIDTLVVLVGCSLVVPLDFNLEPIVP